MHWHGEQRPLFLAPSELAFSSAFAQARQQVGRDGLFYHRGSLYHTLRDVEVGPSSRATTADAAMDRPATLQRLPMAHHAPADARQAYLSQPSDQAAARLQTALPQDVRAALLTPGGGRSRAAGHLSATPLAAASMPQQSQSVQQGSQRLADVGDDIQPSTVRVGRVEELRPGSLRLSERDSLSRSLAASKVTVTPQGQRVSSTADLGQADATLTSESSASGFRGTFSVETRGQTGVGLTAGISASEAEVELRVGAVYRSGGQENGQAMRYGVDVGVRQASLSKIWDHFNVGSSVIERVVNGLDAATGAEVFISASVEQEGSTSASTPVDLAAELPIVNETLSLNGYTLVRVTTTVEATLSGGSKVTYEVSFKARDALILARSAQGVYHVLRTLPAPVLAAMSHTTRAAGSYLSPAARDVCAQVLATAPGAVAGVGVLAASQTLANSELDQPVHRQHLQQQTLEH
jgi:hypothetical protein